MVFITGKGRKGLLILGPKFSEIKTQFLNEAFMHNIPCWYGGVHSTRSID